MFGRNGSGGKNMRMTHEGSQANFATPTPGSPPKEKPNVKVPGSKYDNPSPEMTG